MAKPISNIQALVKGARVKDVNLLRVASAVTDAETITIGGEVFEISTHETAGDITSGNIAVEMAADGVAAQGTLTVDTQVTADDTMTVGDTTYTFKATASAAGEITIGGTLGATQTNIVAAINGDALNTANTKAKAAAFSGNNSVITALRSGTVGNSIATTETFTAGTNVFDAATLGTTTAGVDPTGEEFIDAVLTVINASSTKVTATKQSAEYLLLEGRENGARNIACTETLAGSNNAFAAAATYGGRTVTENAIKRFASSSRVPNATEVTAGLLIFSFPFNPSTAIVQGKVTATNALKALDGDVSISGNNVTVNNDGSTDFAATDTVTVLAVE